MMGALDIGEAQLRSLDAWVDEELWADQPAACGSKVTFTYREGPFRFTGKRVCSRPAGHAGPCSWAKGES